MPDRALAPRSGPDSMFDPDLPPTRGQNHSIAVLACELLGIPAPVSRLDASYAIVQLRQALDKQATAPAPVATVRAA